MTAALPPEWQKLAERAGIRATHRGIAEAANVAPSTISRLILQGRTTEETVAAVARVFRVEPADVYRLARIPQSEDGPWVPPQEAQWLSQRQRAALNELIRTIVADEQPPEADRGDEDSVRRKRRGARQRGIVHSDADEDSRRAQ